MGNKCTVSRYVLQNDKPVFAGVTQIKSGNCRCGTQYIYEIHDLLLCANCFQNYTLKFMKPERTFYDNNVDHYFEDTELEIRLK